MVWAPGCFGVPLAFRPNEVEREVVRRGAIEFYGAAKDVGRHGGKIFRAAGIISRV